MTASQALRALANGIHPETGESLDGDSALNDLARDLCARMPALPVLYMSGYARDTIVRGGRLDAEVNFLEKPFTPEALATMVWKVLHA